jgi:hypothetical protein
VPRQVVALSDLPAAKPASPPLRGVPSLSAHVPVAGERLRVQFHVVVEQQSETVGHFTLYAADKQSLHLLHSMFGSSFEHSGV